MITYERVKRIGLFLMQSVTATGWQMGIVFLTETETRQEVYADSQPEPETGFGAKMTKLMPAVQNGHIKERMAS